MSDDEKKGLLRSPWKMLGVIATAGGIMGGLWEGLGAFQGIGQWWRDYSTAQFAHELDKKVWRCRFAILWEEHETMRVMPDDCVQRAMAELHGQPKEGK